MPAQGDDRAIEPARVQPAVGHHDDGPARGHPLGERFEQGEPFGLPGVGHVGGEDLPGHGNGAAAVHDADRQHGEDGTQAGGIQGQGQPLGRPTFEHPGQQRREAGSDIEFLTLGARLGGGGLVELLEPRAEGVEADAQQGDQGGDDTVEAAPLGEDHAEAVQGQDGGLGPTERGRRRRLARSRRRVVVRRGMGGPPVNTVVPITSCPRGENLMPRQLLTSYRVRKTPPSEGGPGGRGGGAKPTRGPRSGDHRSARGRRTPPTDSWGVRRPRGGQDARPIRPRMGPGRRQAPRRPHDAGRPTRDVAGTRGLRRPARGGRP